MGKKGKKAAEQAPPPPPPPPRPTRIFFRGVSDDNKIAVAFDKNDGLEGLWLAAEPKVGYKPGIAYKGEQLLQSADDLEEFDVVRFERGKASALDSGGGSPNTARVVGYVSRYDDLEAAAQLM